MTILEDLAASFKLMSKDWSTVAQYVKNGVSVDGILDDIKDHILAVVPSLVAISDEIVGRVPGLQDIIDGLPTLNDIIGSLPTLSSIISNVTDVLSAKVTVTPTLLSNIWADIKEDVIDLFVSKFNSFTTELRS